MKRASIVGIAFGIGLAATSAAQEAQVTRGLRVFTDQKCTVCHAVAANGNKKGPLDGVGSKLSADEIRQWIVSPKEMTEKTSATRKPPMKTFKLSRGDVDALVAYLQTLKNK